jgi:hypothetical protein
MRIAFLGNFKVSYTSETHHAASLESLGHSVVRLQEGVVEGPHVEREAVHSDMFVWIHTHGWSTPGIERVIQSCRQRGVPTVTYHLDLWNGLARWGDVRNGPYWQLDHFFTVDKLMAEWLNNNTPVRGHYLPAGVFDRECYISDQPSRHANDVIFVGSRKYHPEWPWRPALISWLRTEYGPRFTHVGPDGDTGVIRGDALNRVYANSKVAVGDTLCIDYEYPWYASDRLFEAPGRGGFQIFPRITGLDSLFTDGETIRFFDFGDFDGIRAMIDHYLDHDGEREKIRLAAHEHVRRNHTYVQRWQHILDTVTR